MPTSPAFSFDGKLAATIRIMGNAYTLVGTSEIGHIGTGTMRLAYHASFDDSLVVGTIQEVFTDLAGLTSKVIKLGDNPINGPGANVVSVVNGLLDQAKGLPGFESALTLIGGVRIRITDLDLLLKVPSTAPASPTDPVNLNGALTIGLGLDFRSLTTAPTLMGITLENITLLVTVTIG